MEGVVRTTAPVEVLAVRFVLAFFVFFLIPQIRFSFKVLFFLAYFFTAVSALAVVGLLSLLISNRPLLSEFPFFPSILIAPELLLPR